MSQKLLFAREMVASLRETTGTSSEGSFLCAGRPALGVNKFVVADCICFDLRSWFFVGLDMS